MTRCAKYHVWKQHVHAVSDQSIQFKIGIVKKYIISEKILIYSIIFLLAFLKQTYDYLCVPVAFVRSLSFVDSKCTPCDLQSRTRSTMKKKNTFKIIFSVHCPYILKIMTHLKLINLIIAPFHLLQRSSRRCNTFRFCGRCTFLDISLYYNPTASMCCPALLPGCIYRSAKIWQTTLEDYHHLSEFSDIVLTRYPKFDCKLRALCDINIISKYKSEYL